MELYLGQKARHKELYDGTEIFEIVGVRKTEVELQGDFSGGTHKVIQTSWVSKEGLSVQFPLHGSTEMIVLDALNMKTRSIGGNICIVTGLADIVITQSGMEELQLQHELFQMERTHPKPADLLELDERIRAAGEQKSHHVFKQEYEKAAIARTLERTLAEERLPLLKKWRDDVKNK